MEGIMLTSQTQAALWNLPEMPPQPMLVTGQNQTSMDIANVTEDTVHAWFGASLLGDSNALFNLHLLRQTLCSASGPATASVSDTVRILEPSASTN
jgi:hypothetical protein